jgi:predicted PurR-regulated permease PerM
MAAFLREAVDAAADFQAAFADGRFAWIEPAWRTLEQRVPAAQRVNVAALVTDAARRGATLLAAQSGSVLLNVAGFMFNLIVALFATFFLSRDSKAIVAAVRRMLPLDEPVRERLISQTRDLVSVSVTSSGIVAAVQGLLGGIVFAAVGIDAAVFWGVVMAFFCLVPLGAWVVWLPAAVLLAIGGSIGRAVIVASLNNIERPELDGSARRCSAPTMRVS